MLRELLLLQLIAVAVTLPVYQQSTTNENELTTSDPEIQTIFGPETESFAEPITGSIVEFTSNIPLEFISTQANQPTQTTAAKILLESIKTRGTDVLSISFVLEEKKKAKNPFPFYAYILFGLVPLFILFILCC